MSSFIGLTADLGFAGTVSRTPAYDATIEIKKGKNITEYGVPVKLDTDGTVTPCTTQSDAVYGILVREFHQEGAEGQIFVSVLRRGYILASFEGAALTVGQKAQLGANGKLQNTGTAIPASTVLQVQGKIAEIAFNI